MMRAVERRLFIFVPTMRFKPSLLNTPPIVPFPVNYRTYPPMIGVKVGYFTGYSRVKSGISGKVKINVMYFT